MSYRLFAVVAALFMAVLATSPAVAQEQEQEGEEFRPVQATETEERSRWGFSGTFLLSEFDSDPFSSFIEEASGYEIELTGRSWDIGLTRGRPGHSYFRIAFVRLTLNDGSWVDDGDTLSFTEDVRLQGIKVERVWRLGPDRWPVAPMFTVHGGIGQLSGKVEEHRRTFEFDPETFEFTEVFLPPRTKEVVESLGYNWLPLFGFGAGVTASIQERLTLTATIVGVEFPGLYKGQLQVIFWF